MLQSKFVSFPLTVCLCLSKKRKEKKLPFCLLVASFAYTSSFRPVSCFYIFMDQTISDMYGEPAGLKKKEKEKQLLLLLLLQYLIKLPSGKDVELIHLHSKPCFFKMKNKE